MLQTEIFEMHFRFLLSIWVRVDCRPTSQQIFKSTSNNLIRKRTGCDEYVEDQLNVGNKNFTKYLFDDGGFDNQEFYGFDLICQKISKPVKIVL